MTTGQQVPGDIIGEGAAIYLHHLVFIKVAFIVVRVGSKAKVDGGKSETTAKHESELFGDAIISFSLSLNCHEGEGVLIAEVEDR